MLYCTFWHSSSNTTIRCSNLWHSSFDTTIRFATLQVIPAENLVAAFQSGPGELLGVATTAADARVLLEALEAGTAGIVLKTEDPVQASLNSSMLWYLLLL